MAEVSLSLTESLNQYLASSKVGKQPQGQLELRRFIQWCGSDRSVSELTPPMIADYGAAAGMWGGNSAQRLKPVRSFLTFLSDQGLLKVSLTSHLKASKAKKGAPRVNPKTPSDQAQLSAEGYANLEARLEMLKQERVKVVGDIRLAMADKDFRENAPLDAAKERQGLIESSIREMENILAHAVVRSADGAGTGPQKVRLGTVVTLRDRRNGKEVRYTLVDSREADPPAGKISSISPVGKALLDKVLGEELLITVPRGTVHYTIEGIGS